jgi:Tfp pilus assembly protein PilO
MKLSLKINNILLYLLLIFFILIILHNIFIKSEGFTEGLENKENKENKETKVKDASGNETETISETVADIKKDLDKLISDFSLLLTYDKNSNGNSVIIPVSKLNSFNTNLGKLQININKLP